jgi:hypothetical protein
MVDQNLVTVFISLTALAVLIQTGILVGFYFVSTKLSRQADQALDMSRKVLGPAQTTVENLRVVSAKLVDFSSKTPAQLRQLEQWLRRRRAA